MHFKTSYLLLFSAIISIWCNAKSSSVSQDIVNNKVVRKVDIASHLVKLTSTITIENTGSSKLRTYLYAISGEEKRKLSFLAAAAGEDAKGSKLQVTSTTVPGQKNTAFYEIKLPSELYKGSSVTISVEAVFTKSLRPFPAEITQSERQYVVYENNLFFYSPYKTTTQTTVVNLASSKLESYTKTKPVSQSESTITYGPYTDKPAYSQSELRVHYENNSPFLTVTNLERIIEVSHWGNIAVEEHVEMVHSGALLKGSFSRYDYQRTQETFASIRTFKTMLPASARDVYYRDEIGNISTSNLRELDDHVEVELRPRFPLYGGWKTKYCIGYNVPSYEYLWNSGDRYVLKARFIDHIYDDQVIDRVTVKIILPEGAHGIESKTPFEVEKSPSTLLYTYLDTVGRPVTIVHKDNVIDQHIQEFELHYTFQKLRLLQEPLLVVGAFYLLFVIIIFYVRLDFAITKDEAKEMQMRVASLLEEVQSTHDKRSALYQSYDDSINKFKANKDTTSFVNSRKKIDADYRQLSQQIGSLQSQLKMQGSDIAEKVAELQKLDQQYKEQITAAIQHAEKVVSGKLSKQQYIDNDAATTKKREEINGKMETLLATL